MGLEKDQERKIDLIWGIYDIPTPETEYKFHPTRNWRFDYAWPNQDLKIAVEIEGGIWVRGAHTRGKHFLSDCEKYNVATSLGWEVYRFTPDQLKTGYAQTFMKQVFK